MAIMYLGRRHDGHWQRITSLAHLILISVKLEYLLIDTTPSCSRAGTIKTDTALCTNYINHSNMCNILCI